MVIEDELLKIVVCPQCRGLLELRKNVLHCQLCNYDYPIKRHIPILTSYSQTQLRRDTHLFYETAATKDDVFDSKFTRIEVLKSKLIDSIIKERTFDYVLDIGSAEGPHTRLLKKVSNNLIAMDISIQRLYKFKNKYNVTDLCVRADVEELPFKENAFDFVLMTEVLEHVPDNKTSLRLIRDCLSIKGILLITVPNNEEISPNRDQAATELGIDLPINGHLHSYTKDSLKQMMKTLGFNVLEIREVFTRKPPYLGRFIPERFARLIPEVAGKLFCYSHIYCLATKGNEGERN
ncbi:2-polyprenyl-3-methyl-5-hydroxy-6-metoxy-1,4-benzoquinol methylase [Candidatus Methanophagaceae archaeon]|nr:2-polyprenyl-3-methyl-5-hydroxy-6-metoxy-1,4-benzoquinol methylase [Methanophagales archaeon]